MESLYNSRGKHIANLKNGQLYSARGKNIGRFIESGNIFVDITGRYLSEIVDKNRLLYNKNSSYKSVNFGSTGNSGNIGNYGNPGNIGSLGMPGGYADIETEE